MHILYSVFSLFSYVSDAKCVYRAHNVGSYSVVTIHVTRDDTPCTYFAVYISTFRSYVFVQCPV
jgi:hypothetical protein